MKTLILNPKYLVLILVTVLIAVGTQSSSGQTITASVDTPLTEATLDGSVVTLTLSGGTYERSIFDIRDGVTVSGIEGVTYHWVFGVDRVSDTKITVELEFNGNFDTDAMLIFTVGADAIANYNGPALTAQILVRAKSVIASTEGPLTETELNGSVVTLTLHNGVYAPENIVGNAVTVSGITGVTIGTAGVQRVNDTAVTVTLEFDGNFDIDKTLTFTVGADAISDYNGDDFTTSLSVHGYMQGPWLWMVVPTDATEVDSLAAASDGAVTEANIAQNGVNEGETVGQLQWRSGAIVSTERPCREFCNLSLFVWHCRTVCWENNLNDTANLLGFGTGDNIEAHTAYALINLVSPRNQGGTMKVLSGDTFKVWLNGEAIHREVATNLGCRKVDIPVTFDRTDCTPDPRTSETRYSAFSFPVTLNAGNNLLLVQVSQHGEYWGMRVQLALDAADVSTAIPTAQDAEATPTTQDTETSLMAIKGTVTPEDGTPADAGLQVTVTIGSNTQTVVSEAGGVYSVIFLTPQGIVATSGDTVTVEVLNPNTGATTERTVSLSSEQITAKKATIDLQFSPSGREYLLSVPEGISLIHVPLKVTAVDGVTQTLESVADLYDALGGAATVSLLITLDPQAQRWVGYFASGDRGSSADKVLTDDLGIIAVMTAPASVQLSGDGLGINGSSSITLHPGMNLVGVPLKDSRITRVTDLFALEGIKDNVSLTLVSDNGEIKLVEQPGDSGDIPVTGGQSFILVAKSAATVEISGAGWSNVPDPAVAPSTALTGIEVRDTTPVLAVSGSILPPVGGASLPRLGVTDFSVTIKNLSTGKVDTSVTDNDGVTYQFTFVDIERGRAAQVGDILEITAHSADPLIGVHPVRHTVTVEDVKRSRIPLAELVAYEIPAKTELLLNYPNPFNPETWIPYRLAKDAFVTVTIYDQRGRVVRQLNVGHQLAAVYESRSEAIYWDGRTDLGERVASGIYFYTLTAGDYSATRKMIILK